MEREIDKIIKAKLHEHRNEAGKKPDLLNVPKGNLDMFKVRYNIETELRRIWQNRFEKETEFDFRRHQPFLKIITDLAKYGYLHENFPGVLREILSICNYAIHGEELSENQIHFVEINAVGVIDYLRQLK